MEWWRERAAVRKRAAARSAGHCRAGHDRLQRPGHVRDSESDRVRHAIARRFARGRAGHGLHPARRRGVLARRWSDPDSQPEERMKLVTAIIRPEKLNDVLESLFHANVAGLTISRVQGHGGETERVET